MKRKIFLLLLFILVLSVYKKTNQEIIIPDSSIRLRVIPNSNEPQDIYIKEEVKSYLEKNVYNLTKNVNSIEEAREVISNDIPNIKSNVDKIFNNNEYPLSYNVKYGYNYFPTKNYKGVNYKEGYYESLVIEIGEANGDNWWCVLFPNYCLIDKNNSLKSKSLIKELIIKYYKNK